VAGGVLALGLLLAGGALTIPSAAGYAGVGPNFLPWVVAIGLLLCGGFLAWEAFSGGFRQMDDLDGAVHGHWPGFVWVSCRHPGQRRADHHHRLHPQLRAVLHAGGAGFKSAEGRLDLSVRPGSPMR
jgi:putative tricarboxylic transport membrane protein